jgi:biotin carboxyl carrier protein
VTQDRTNPGDGPRDEKAVRTPENRRRDHDEIDRLTDALLPDLIDRLAASGLGEIEVREDDWRIRLQRPATHRDGSGRAGERGTDRPVDRGGHDRGERTDRGDRADRSTDRQARAGAHGTDARPYRDAREGQPLRAAVSGSDGNGNGTGPGGGLGSHRVIALSPAVGVFQPHPAIRPGARVRAGDRVASVDLLGLPQDVVAPEDGVVIDTLVEAGQGVEYGQELIVIEPARSRHGADGTNAPAPMTES